MTYTYSIGGDFRITFDSKPDESIRSMLKSCGFRWSPSAGCWWRRKVTGAADFLDALTKRLRPAGLPDGACHRQRKNGVFCGKLANWRSWAACTFLFCDDCWFEYCSRRDAEMRADPVDLAYEDQCRSACGL